MPSTINKAIFSALAAATSVSAHGFVTNIVANGVFYEGYDVTRHPYQAEEPTVVGWTNTATDTGFVAPDAYGSPDIICHRGATNAKGHATVAAGDSVFVKWNDWPESHKGPVLDYLASCGSDGCESVDKTELKFFKIGEAGLIDGSTAPGFYAADELIDNGLGWMVQIPESVKPGFYVLRHEIIALHGSHEANGAQNYPQCISLQITGSGIDEPEGTLGTELYKADDAGIFFNIYRELAANAYPIPGPSVIAGASAVDQTTSAVTATGTATTGNKLVPAPTNGSGSDEEAPIAAPTTTAAQEPTAPETTATAAPSASDAGDDLGAVIPSAGPTKTVDIVPGATDINASPSTPTNLPVCKGKKSKKSKGKKSKGKKTQKAKAAQPTSAY